MTVEWREVCERCGDVHEARPDGLSVEGCADRAALLGLLRQRPSDGELVVQWYDASGKEHWTKQNVLRLLPGGTPVPLPAGARMGQASIIQRHAVAMPPHYVSFTIA